jgi:hypothetical protein
MLSHSHWTLYLVCWPLSSCDKRAACWPPAKTHRQRGRAPHTPDPRCAPRAEAQRTSPISKPIAPTCCHRWKVYTWSVSSSSPSTFSGSSHHLRRLSADRGRPSSESSGASSLGSGFCAVVGVRVRVSGLELRREGDVCGCVRTCISERKDVPRGARGNHYACANPGVMSCKKRPIAQWV